MRAIIITLILLTSGCAHGQIYRQVLAERETICAGVSNCDDKLNETFVARLAYRYPRADMGRVTTRCRAYPGDCTPENVEKWARQSHMVGALGSAGEDFSGLSRSLSSPKPINCITRPDGLGGYTSSCK